MSRTERGKSRRGVLVKNTKTRSGYRRVKGQILETRKLKMFTDRNSALTRVTGRFPEGVDKTLGNARKREKTTVLYCHLIVKNNTRMLDNILNY
ncbi:hypothetical protein TNCT_674281 [Trichonephila clavata]|uniref:Uncharacterized protein n=1 Tax=Trichonephila clavata TaxID=2740835 RepID=A0A8X6HJ40_TRICU|nr:hypothetical protein TNCT_674281 [Trichonephila clavata]